MPLEVHTTDFVVSEIEEPEQNTIILGLVESERLFVAGLASEEVDEILNMQLTDNRLSIPDC